MHPKGWPGPACGCGSTVDDYQEGAYKHFLVYVLPSTVIGHLKYRIPFDLRSLTNVPAPVSTMVQGPRGNPGCYDFALPFFFPFPFPFFWTAELACRAAHWHNQHYCI